MTWRVYYADGSMFDSTHGSPADAPKTGVVCITQVNRMHGATTTAMKDVYLWRHGQWFGADQFGFWQFMFEAGAKVALFGVSVPDETFHRIHASAVNDQDFAPLKTARSPIEFPDGRPWT